MGGIFLLVGLTVVFFAWRFASSPDGKKLVSAVSSGATLLSEAAGAPGTKELRTLGCDTALVFDARRVQEVAAAFGDAGKIAGEERLVVTCSVNAVELLSRSVVRSRWPTTYVAAVGDATRPPSVHRRGRRRRRFEEGVHRQVLRRREAQRADDAARADAAGVSSPPAMSEPITVSTYSKRALRPAATAPTLHGDPCTLVIFGAVGDLARRKLMPAIYYLAKEKLLAEGFRIVGVGIEPLDDAKYRDAMRAALSSADEVRGFDEAVFADLAPRLSWVGGNLAEAEVYGALETKLTALEAKLPSGERNRLFHMAVPPAIFATIIQHLSQKGVCPKIPDPTARPWRRAIIEKPFGHDLASAKALSEVILGSLAEHQVYRIDHYVGKETVQNILVLRSANAIFEAVWSREHITHVEITAAETVGVEERARYYESSGVVRDMFQNHLLQLLALTAMEPPAEPTADAIRDEKVKVLRSILPIVEGDHTDAVRAQYTKGEVKGASAPGYREEQGISPTSTTPTYAALRVMIDTDRWRGVPFYLRSGKRLAKRWSEVVLHFRTPRRLMYEPVPTETLAPNVLCLRIQPDDGVSLGFEVKVPGAALALTPGIEVQEVKMDFNYADAFGAEVHPAYETLLLDCMIGDATLFTRTDEVEAAWGIIDPLLAACEDAGKGAPLAAVTPRAQPGRAKRTSSSRATGFDGGPSSTSSTSSIRPQRALLMAPETAPVHTCPYL